LDGASSYLVWAQTRFPFFKNKNRLLRIFEKNIKFFSSEYESDGICAGAGSHRESEAPRERHLYGNAPRDKSKGSQLENGACDCLAKISSTSQ